MCVCNETQIVTTFEVFCVCCLMTHTYIQRTHRIESFLRVFVWMIIGIILYFSYGYKHSKLNDEFKGLLTPNNNANSNNNNNNNNNQLHSNNNQNFAHIDSDIAGHHISDQHPCFVHFSKKKKFFYVFKTAAAHSHIL